MGGSLGIVSTYRRHLIAGLITYTNVQDRGRPVKFFAHLFSDFLALLSQIELSDASDKEKNARLKQISGKERKRVLQRVASEQTMTRIESSKRQRLVLFRIERVFNLVGRKVELQLLNRGFGLDDQHEFSVEGSRLTLHKWFDAFRGCEGVGQLVDSAQGAQVAASTAVEEEATSEDPDMEFMMDEFNVYDSVVRKDGPDEQDQADSQWQEVLKKVNTDPSRLSSASEALKSIFVPPPFVALATQQTALLKEHGNSKEHPKEEGDGKEEEKKAEGAEEKKAEGAEEKKEEGEDLDEAGKLAMMLKSSQYTLRLLRQTGTLRRRDSSDMSEYVAKEDKAEL